MSNTYYVPDEAGWAGNGGYIRLKVDQTYNAASNTSTLVCTVQGYSLAWTDNYNGHLFGAITAGDTTLLANVAHNNYRINFARDSTWRDMYDTATGATVTFTFTVQHDSSGTASVLFTLGSVTSGGNGFQIKSNWVNLVWPVSSATLTFTEQRGNVRIGIGNVPKRGQMYIGINNTPKLVKELYIGVNGVPKRCI